VVPPVEPVVLADPLIPVELPLAVEFDPPVAPAERRPLRVVDALPSAFVVVLPIAVPV
jgi:hypothetical protein